MPVTPPRSDAAALNNPPPPYPRLARTLGEQGRVLLDVYILADGSVGQVKLHRSSGYARLDQAAIDAVRGWHYIPAKRGGVPIPYWYVQPIDFELQ
jgi:protein TonB